MRSILSIVLLAFVIEANHAQRYRVPVDIFYVEPTVGQPWPKPQNMQITLVQYAIHPAAFHFAVNDTSQTCDLLTSAFDRYYRMIFFPKSYMDYVLYQKKETTTQPKKKLEDLKDATLLKRLTVNIQTPCETYPNLESDESCM